MSDEPADPAAWWETQYDAETQPWSIDRPQPALVAAVDPPRDGRLLDVGCGRGEHALHFADRCADAAGVDFATNAVEQARSAAAAHDADATFHVASALDLPQDMGPFDVVVDAGLFHVFDDDDRAAYVASLREVTDAGSRLYLLAFGPDAPTDFGPTPVDDADIRRAFDDGWTVERVTEAPFETRGGAVPGLLAELVRR